MLKNEKLEAIQNRSVVWKGQEWLADKYLNLLNHHSCKKINAVLQDISQKNIEGIFLNFVGKKTGLVLTDWRGVLNKFAQNWSSAVWSLRLEWEASDSQILWKAKLQMI